MPIELSSFSFFRLHLRFLTPSEVAQYYATASVERLDPKNKQAYSRWLARRNRKEMALQTQEQNDK